MVSQLLSSPLWPSLLAAVDFVGPSTQYTFQVVGAVIGTITVLVMLLFAIPGFVILVRNDRWRTLPLLAVVLGVVVILLLWWGNPRFRLPAEPALAIATATAGCVAHLHYRGSATHQDQM